MDVGRKRELEDKVYAGERLTRADGIALYESDDLVWLGRLAHHVRTRRNGDRALFSVNRLLDLTSVSAVEHAVAEAVGTAVAAAERLADEQLTEVHLVTSLDPTLPWDCYPRMLRAVRETLPKASLKCFTATEIHQLERTSGRSAEQLLDELIDAGLAALTGGDAESFDWEVRQDTVDGATRWEDWSRIHRLAHARGLKSPATMRYGHVEEPRHRVDHVLRLRELQDETGGFAVFIPLPSQDGTAAVSPAESLKTFAVSRLLFDNVAHVKASWLAHGLSVAQLSLHFGADELDGSAAEYKTVDGTPGTVHRDELLHLIWDAGFRPVERDARYEIVREYDPAPSLAERRAEPQQVWA